MCDRSSSTCHSFGTLRNLISYKRNQSSANPAVRFLSSQYPPYIIKCLKSTLSLPALESRRINSRLCLLHCFFYQSSTRHTLLIPPVRTSSRLAHTCSIAHINVRTTKINHSFFPHAITLWNTLPNVIAYSLDREKLREKITCHFVQQ